MLYLFLGLEYPFLLFLASLGFTGFGILWKTFGHISNTILSTFLLLVALFLICAAIWTTKLEIKQWKIDKRNRENYAKLRHSIKSRKIRVQEPVIIITTP